MLYVDQVAETEELAVEIACRKMRLEKENVVVRSVREVPEGMLVRVEALKSRGQEAAGILEGILKGFGIKVELFYIESCDNVLINLKGPHLGLIIGKAGSTLEALETVISAMHNNGYPMYKPVVINPGGYRENKRKALRILVKRACDAAKDGQKVSLPIMRQRDRKQVHQLIKDFPGFQSRSVGDGKDRRVCIYCEGDEDTGSDEQADDASDFIPPLLDAASKPGTDSQSMSL